MLTIHHLHVSQSERIVWLCEELEIPYDLKLYPRDPVTRMAPPEYKALHPMGTAPVITDGDLVLAESGAIVEYIIATHGDGRLACTKADPHFTDYLFWFHFANATLLPGAMFAMAAAMLGATDHPMAAMMNARADTAHTLLENRLAIAPCLAGPFSAADIMTVFALTTMRAFAPRDLAGAPNTRAYLQRIAARPAYQRAMAKADPDMPPMVT